MPKLSASEALAQTASRIAAITGLSAEEILSVDRRQKVVAARHLAIQYVYGSMGYCRGAIARALPSEKQGKPHRNVTTISHSAIRGAELREDQDVDLLVRAVLEQGALQGAEKRKAAFEAAWARELAAVGGRRIALEAVQRCFAAAARAHPVRLLSRTTGTAVPVTLPDPEPVRQIRNAPAFRDLVPSLSWSPTDLRHITIEFVSPKARETAASLLRRLSRWLSDGGWRAEERPLAMDDAGGWRASLRAAIAAIAGLALLGQPATIQGAFQAEEGAI